MLFKAVWGLLGIIATVVLIPLLHFTYSLYSTVPKRLDSKIPTLTERVQIEWDKWGVPTIRAKNVLDAIRAQGFVTAQDRLFQMELTRRKMVGTLSEVFGSKAIEVDETARFFNFRKIADEAYVRMAKRNQEVLEAYAEGVNAWRVENPSFEQRLLQIPINRWQPADTLLIILAMFQTLDRWENDEEVTYNVLKEKFPEAVVNFLTQDFGFFDAVLLPGDKPVPIPPPPANVFSLRDLKTAGFGQMLEDQPVSGSNAWVIPSSSSKSGKPILSGDPHLSITMPNLWYRVHLLFQNQEIVGASIPGIPLVVIGTNRNLAWTFTNAYADTVDFVPVEEKHLKTRTEVIHARWGEDHRYEIRESPWGPVIGEEDHRLAIQWAALDPTLLSQFDLLAFNASVSIPEAKKVLESWSGPVQNCFLADTDGNTGWLLVGKVPRRLGFDGRSTVSRDSTHNWKGYLDASEMPSLINPKGQIISNGNQRTAPVGPNLYQTASSWPSPARGYRLKEIFDEKKVWDPANSAGVQLDTFSVLHLWYRDKLASILKDQKDPWAEAIYSLIVEWNGRLSVDSSAYIFLKRFRLALIKKWVNPLLTGMNTEEATIVEDFFTQRDEWIAQLLKQQPMHWLPKNQEDYSSFLIGIAKEVASDLTDSPDKLKKLRWGDFNHAEYKHALSRLVPPLSSLLDLPSVELNGDSLVPRVERPKHSASLRISVDLGDLKQSLYSQPGGQSGHPLSVNYKNQFAIWREGNSIPLFPGDPEVTATLTP